MMSFLKTIKTTFLTIVIAFVVSGCAGSTDPFGVSPGSLSFLGNTNGDVRTPYSQTLTAVPNQGGMLLMIIVPTIVDLGLSNLYICGTNACIDVVPVAPSSIGVGNYNDVIEFTACTDLSSVPTSCYNTQIHQVNVPMSYTVSTAFSLTPSETQTPTARVAGGYTGYIVDFSNPNDKDAIRKVDIPDDTVPHLFSR